jgi:hypothetical protein
MNARAQRSKRPILDPQAEMLRLALEWLLAVSRLDHGSMCPATRCTCDLDETRRHAADNAAAVLAAVDGREPLL